MKRDRRFNARLTPEQRELFERAAAFFGQTLSQFALSAAQRAALETIYQHEIITFSARDSREVMAALQYPEPAVPLLRQATDRYKELLGDG